MVYLVILVNQRTLDGSAKNIIQHYISFRAELKGKLRNSRKVTIYFKTNIFVVKEMDWNYGQLLKH